MPDMIATALRPAGTVRSRVLLPLWIVTVFISALLVFSVQPMFAKMVLPLLGGSPAVWSTSLVFFQGMLLAGYLYAHCSATLLTPARQAMLHLGLLAAATFVLPITVGLDTVPPTDGPILWLLGYMFVCVGLPFFTLSANAPLLQCWFARTGHPASADPYFLYAASNLGSMLALLGYPFVIERVLDVHEQSSVWASGFLALMLLAAGCAAFIWRESATPAADRAGPAADAAPVTWLMRGRWVTLAAVPSALLVGVTAHISVDVAAVPLLWVVPLALYLLTFALVFARRPLIRHEWIVLLLPCCIVLLAALFWLRLSLWISVPLHLIAFFAMTMMCHGELARLRPPASQATEFYLLMSLGGVIGGALSALLAPAVFKSVLEYPLAIVLACLLRPARASESSWRAYALDIALPLLLIATARSSAPLLLLPKAVQPAAVFVLLCVLAIAAFSFQARPLRFALGVAAVLSFVPGRAATDVQPLLQLRSFFGVHRVTLDQGGAVHVLTHGRTIHGMQHTDPARRREPMSYYTAGSPLGQSLAARIGGLRRDRIGVVGLGAGAAACHRRPGEDWVFYEIDPLVRHIARDTPYFTYLADCAPDSPIEMGDARLTLKKTPNASYDVLVIDAFSSDAIPIHLLTREAVALYLDKVRDGGIVMLHISNRYLRLLPIIARIAAAGGLEIRAQTHRPPPGEGWPSQWVVLARREADLGPLARDERWQRPVVDPTAPLWTDSFSNILDALKH